MKNTLTLVLFLSLLSSPIIAADFQKVTPEDVGMSSERLARIIPYMEHFVESGELAGVQTLIARDGKVVHFDQVGKLNLETGERLQEDSLFRIYSMTKPIASTAAMILYEEGYFQLNDPVEKYLPEFKGAQVLIDGQLVDANHPFTIRELMSHTAGLTYGIFGNTPVDQKYQAAIWEKGLGFKENIKDLDDLVDVMGTLPLQYQPGEQWV